MKIFHVLHGFHPELTGGTERTVAALAGAMQTEGHEVTVVCGSLQLASTDHIDELEDAGIRVLRLHRDDLYFENWWKCYHPGISRTFAELVAAEKPDVVHVHHWLRLTSDLLRIARCAGARTVVTLHDYFAVLARVVRRYGDDQVLVPDVAEWVSALEAEEAFSMHRRDFHDELRAAHLTLAPSAAHAAGIRDLALPGLDAIQVAPTPLLERPEPLAHAPVAGGRRLVTWGSLYPDKGLEVLIDAMHEAAGDWSLRVLGEPSDRGYEKALQSRAGELDVSFTGFFGTEDLSAIEADYAVLPSICYESYGLVVDEAMLLGLPMIASALPAYREHADPASCVFVEPGDVAALAAVLDDGPALARLQRPSPPKLINAATAAHDLLSRYKAIDPSTLFEADPNLERDRARMLFRRSDRRLWTALNSPDLPLPPDSFLA